MKYYGNEKEGISLNEPMHTLPTKDRVALIEVVQVPNALTPEQLEGARACAALMQKIPAGTLQGAGRDDHGQRLCAGGPHLALLQPPELKLAQGFEPDYIIDHGLFVESVTGAEE
ncbi:hypothetical protein [Pseudomonas azerbaijanoccidentalis]